MSISLKRSCFILLLSVLFLSACDPTFAAKKSQAPPKQSGITPAKDFDPGLHPEILTQLNWAGMRDKHLDKNALLRLLDVKPGMTILEIGSGTGHYAYACAEKMNGTGEVFATDVLPVCVDYMARESRRKGLSIIHPILVQRTGVDEFYSKHRYDLVLVFNTYFGIYNPVGYFREIRDFLAENGEIAILIYENAPFLSRDDITDFKDLSKALLSDTTNSAILGKMRKTTRTMLKEQAGLEPDHKLKTAIVEDLNGILLDPNFYRNFFKSGLRFSNNIQLSPRGREFANWLLMSLREEGVLDKPIGDLTTKERRTVKKLNRLLITEKLGKYFFKDGYLPYLPGADVHRQTSRFQISREMAEAGYALKEEHDLDPYYFMLIFKKR